MSQTPDLPEEGHEHLRRALHQLPTHEPAPTTWTRIENQLAAEQAIQRALPELPSHIPADGVWDIIAGRLDQLQAASSPVPEVQPVKPGVIRTLWPAKPLRLVAGLAAAILVMVLAWWQGTTPHEMQAPRETISYTEETVDVPPTAASTLPRTNDPLGQQGVAFIDSHCTSLPTVCQSGEFKELRTQLTELETEEQQLQQDSRRFGATPELVRHQVRVTTMKATVTRELIQLLIS